MLVACSTCVRLLQSRVTSSSTTVNSWMILFLFFYFFDCLFCFVVVVVVGQFVDVCFQVRCCCHFFFSVCIFVFVPRRKCRFHFNVDGGIVKLQSSAGQKFNFSYFRTVYKFELCQGTLAVIRGLFIILYISSLFH